MTVTTTDAAVRSADGTEIGYLQLGSGPPIVLVHGAWGDADAWLDVARHLADRFSCYLVDRRGRGRSGDRVDYALDREVEDIEAVLTAAGPDSSLLGHSSGAIYALEVARRTPVRRLVLYEPPLRQLRRPQADSFLHTFRAELDAAGPEAAATWFFRHEVQMPDDELSVLQSTPTWPQMAELAGTCLREWEAIVDADLDATRYRDIATPTLLLVGTETRDHPSFVTRQLEQLLPTVSTTLFDGQGHMANRAVPDVVARAVTRFLNVTDPTTPETVRSPSGRP